MSDPAFFQSGHVFADHWVKRHLPCWREQIGHLKKTGMAQLASLGPGSPRSCSTGQCVSPSWGMCARHVTSRRQTSMFASTEVPYIKRRLLPPSDAVALESRRATLLRPQTCHLPLLPHVTLLAKEMNKDTRPLSSSPHASPLFIHLS